MNEFSMMAKEATEVAKDIRDDAKELGDKKIYKDTTVKDAAKTVVIAGMAYGTGGAPVVAAYVGGKLLEVAGKEAALEAGCSEQTASKIGTGAKVIGGIVSGAAVEGISGVEGAGEISEVASKVADKVDTGVIDYDVPVVQAGELSDTSKNLIASDKVDIALELDVPIAQVGELSETGGKLVGNNIEKDVAKLDLPVVSNGSEISNVTNNVEKEVYVEKIGGSYKEVKEHSSGETHEVHHMPSDDASFLERYDGPSIKMEKFDHRITASYGNSHEARAYREEQRSLIDEGKFREAQQMDIDDIREKFGDKYDDAILEMQKYTESLEKEGKLNG